MDNVPENSSAPSKTKDGIVMYKKIMDLLNSPDSKKVLNDVKEKDIIIFIGTTRSGKSTLVNFAIGNKLEAVLVDDYDDEYIIKNREESKGPIIGELSVSETTIPTIWKTKRSNLRGDIVDAPGFDDNRGAVQDIANAFYISEIIRNAKSVKFALVADIHGFIHDDTSIFVNLIEKLHTVFPDIEVLDGGIALIFSKVEKENTTQEKICRQLKDKILMQDKLDINGREWVQYFVDNKTCIAFFKRPTSGGIINEEKLASGFLDTIESKIKPISGKKLSNVKPGIAKSSLNVLFKSYSILRDNDGYSSMLQRIEDSVDRKCIPIKHVKAANSTFEAMLIDGTLLNLQKSVEDLADRVHNLVTLTGALDFMIELSSACGIKINTEQKEHFFIIVQFFGFIERTLQIPNTLSILIGKLESTMKKIIKTIQVARLEAANKMNKISLEEMEKQKRVLEMEHTQEREKLMLELKRLQMENEMIIREQQNRFRFFEHFGRALDSLAGCNVM